MTRTTRTALLILLVLTGCSGPAAEQNTGDNSSVGQPTISAKPIKAEEGVRDKNMLVERGDMNGDGKWDVWKYTKEIPGDSPGTIKTVLLKKEADLNFDSRKDVLIEYNENMQVEREVFDFDFDGVVDQENHYVDAKVKEKWLFAPGTGKIMIWKYFEDGALSRVKQDENGDGIADTCEDWFKGQRLIRKGTDTTKDGECDEWKTIQ